MTSNDDLIVEPKFVMPPTSKKLRWHIGLGPSVSACVQSVSL